MSLMLEADTQRVSADELSLIVPPEGTSTWKPISHTRVFDMVTDTLGQLGFNVASMDLAVAKEGHQFFGVLDLRHEVSDGVSLAVGIRNATDKTFSAAMCAGDRVMVCSNLQFGSEIQIAMKHTAKVEDHFHVGVMQSVLKLRQYAEASKARIEGLRSRVLSDHEADSILLRSYEKNVVGARTLPKLIHEWREPSHEEFQPRTAWSLLNCYTEVMKPRQESQPIAAAQEVIGFQSFILN